MNGRWVVAAVAAAVAGAVVPSVGRAQGKSLLTIDIGTGSRVGSMPLGYTQAGNEWSGYFLYGRRVRRDLFLSVSGGMAMQGFTILTRTDSSYGGAYDFHSYVLSVGPTVVTRPATDFLAIGSIQPALVVSFWGLGSVDQCPESCSQAAQQPGRQTQTMMGALFTFSFGYQVTKHGAGTRPWGLGLTLRGLAAPVHGRSGIPVSQVGVSFGFVLGEP